MHTVNEFDSIYRQACELVEKYKPCQIKDDTCIRFRKGMGANFCCGKCNNLIENSCSVKALQCKLEFCKAAWEDMDFSLKLKFTCLKKEAIKNNFYVIKGGVSIRRQTKEDFFPISCERLGC